MSLAHPQISPLYKLLKMYVKVRSAKPQGLPCYTNLGERKEPQYLSAYLTRGYAFSEERRAQIRAQFTAPTITARERLHTWQQRMNDLFSCIFFIECLPKKDQTL
jgi:hypothetical protein